MYVERHTVELTTDAQGDAAGYTPVVSGRVLAVLYTKGTLADTADVVVSTEATGQTVWAEDNLTASKIVYPRTQVHGTDGVGLVHPAEEGEPVCEPVVAANERIKVVVAGGGSGTSGAFTVIVG